MSEHASEASDYPWLQHSVATDGSGLVVADLCPSVEAVGETASASAGQRPT